MEVMTNKEESFWQTITAKAIFITILTILLLIPGIMIQELIGERQERSEEVTRQINSKWGGTQTISGVILTIPFTRDGNVEEENRRRRESGILSLTPDDLLITVELQPEERYYGIYKTILYKSLIDIKGEFNLSSLADKEEITYHFEKSNFIVGIKDFKGITGSIEFRINGKTYQAKPGENNPLFGPVVRVYPDEVIDLSETKQITFGGDFLLKGSSAINFLPLGKHTTVNVKGDWKNPGFTGDFAPDYTLSNGGFDATWNVMNFNRNLPDQWNGSPSMELYNAGFGVNLISPVNHYQQNMRSAKYALMFIALTFVVFFFVELLTHKRIHLVQYLLVGVALVLFYSLLLSLSEQINFAFAYLIASVATIGLIVSYAYSIFKNKVQTGILAVILAGLYLFLFTILQLEDIALLIGSVGLFIILAVIMYFSRKINWYKTTE